MSMNGMPPTGHCEEDVRAFEEGGKADTTHLVRVCTDMGCDARLGNALVTLLTMNDVTIKSDPTHLTAVTMVIGLNLSSNITKDMTNVTIITSKLNTTRGTTLLSWAYVSTHPTTYRID